MASKSIFIATDWINLEGRLTAYFSGDPTLNRMLEEELTGGHKVHAQTAGMLYGIDPGDAKKSLINLQGRMVPAYDGGKRLRHGWHYGMKERKMAQMFWIAVAEAKRINEVMTATHPEVVAWWHRLGDEVFGVPLYVCPRCDTQTTAGGQCMACDKPGLRMTPNVRFTGWSQPPTRVLYTPFRRRRLYLGRRSESMNALISQSPQSTGASMWYRTLQRLHGQDPAGGDWPVPDGVRVWTRSMSYEDLIERPWWGDGPLDEVVTGTYDSYVLECMRSRADEVMEWVLWTMEQSWPELGGRRFPADVAIGENWGKYHEQENPGGLRECKYRPLSAEWKPV